MTFFLVVNPKYFVKVGMVIPAPSAAIDPEIIATTANIKFDEIDEIKRDSRRSHSPIPPPRGASPMRDITDTAAPTLAYGVRPFPLIVGRLLLSEMLESMNTEDLAHAWAVA